MTLLGVTRGVVRGRMRDVRVWNSGVALRAVLPMILTLSVLMVLTMSITLSVAIPETIPVAIALPKCEIFSVIMTLLRMFIPSVAMVILLMECVAAVVTIHDCMTWQRTARASPSPGGWFTSRTSVGS